MNLDILKKIILEVKEENSALLAKPVLLQEMSFNRAKRHIENEGIEFAMISAYRGGKAQPGNKGKHKEMKAAYKTAGFSFVEMLGGYSEEARGEVTEPSLLVLDHPRPDIQEKPEPLFEVTVRLAERYEQDSFIYGRPTITAVNEPAFKEDPKSGELKPLMDIRAYDQQGGTINKPWAGPWNNLVTAKEDDVYWSVVGAKRARLAEVLQRYKKMNPSTRVEAMKKDFYLKSAKSGLKHLIQKKVKNE